jgi:hypothetical protein
MAKLDGRNDVEAWKNQGLNATIIAKRRPIAVLSLRHIAE